MAPPSNAQKAIIKETLPLVKSRMLLITTEFYRLIFETQKDAHHYFNMSHHGNVETHAPSQNPYSQPKAIANALLCVASHLDQITQLLESEEGIDLIQNIVTKHVACQLSPTMYAPVGAIFIQAIETNIGSEAATPEVLEAWSAFYFFVADLLIGLENEMHDMLEKLPGGWRAGREFIITEKDVQTPHTESDHEDSQRKWIRLTLRSKDGLPVIKPKPGQYITLTINENYTDIDGQEKSLHTTRHYTVCDLCEEGENVYKICINVINCGLVSNFVLNHKNIGDTLTLYPPVGRFGLTENTYNETIFKVDTIAKDNNLVFEDLDKIYPLGVNLEKLKIGDLQPSPGSVVQRRKIVLYNYPGAILPPKEIIQQEGMIIKQLRKPMRGRGGPAVVAGSRRNSLDQSTHSPATNLRRNSLESTTGHENEPSVASKSKDEDEEHVIKLLFCAWNSGITPFVAMCREVILYEKKLEFLKLKGIHHNLPHIEVTILHFVKQTHNFMLIDETRSLHQQYPFISFIPVFYHQNPMIEFSTSTTFFLQLCRYYAHEVLPENVYMIGPHLFLKTMHYTLSKELNFDCDGINYEFLGPTHRWGKMDVI